MKKSIKDKVKEILTNVSYTRDCDYKLYLAYIKTYHFNFSLNYPFLTQWINVQIAGGKHRGEHIPCISVIMRRRRELQKKFPELQGHKYYRRQEELQKQALKEAGYEHDMTLPNDKGMTP